MWENICLNYRNKYRMRAAPPVHSKNHFANYQLSIASRHRCMEVLFHCHLNTEYLLTRNQTGVYEHTLHDRESNTKYTVLIKMNISKESINWLLMPKKDDQLLSINELR